MYPTKESNHEVSDSCSRLGWGGVGGLGSVGRLVCPRRMLGPCGTALSLVSIEFGIMSQKLFFSKKKALLGYIIC